MRNYKKIKAFQLANDLVLRVYEQTKSFPKEEVFGMTSQLRRACVSVATNIVEGAQVVNTKKIICSFSISRADH